MIIYDDKTEGIIASREKFILPHSIECNDITFKASYIVESDIKCDGKITALFDLIVIGDIDANEIDVKGRLLCFGKCKANVIVVYDEIWSNEISAKTIETNGRMVVQEIKANTIVAEGGILVARTLDIDETAESGKSIICGETVFGAGMISAPVVFTGEPLDLDDGEDAVIIKGWTKKQSAKEGDCHSKNADNSNAEIDVVKFGEKVFKQENDYGGYLDYIITHLQDEEELNKFNSWKATLQNIEVKLQSLDNCVDSAQLIWLSEIASSDYFRNWPLIDDMFIMLDQHFLTLIQNNSGSLVCEISSYVELLRALKILYKNGDIMSEEIYHWIYEQLISNLGLKPEFIHKRLEEKGWEVHAK